MNFVADEIHFLIAYLYQKGGGGGTLAIFMNHWIQPGNIYVKVGGGMGQGPAAEGAPS